MRTGTLWISFVDRIHHPDAHVPSTRDKQLRGKNVTALSALGRGCACWQGSAGCVCRFGDHIRNVPNRFDGINAAVEACYRVSRKAVVPLAALATVLLCHAAEAGGRSAHQRRLVMEGRKRV
jgi:hypothetical protein